MTMPPDTPRVLDAQQLKEIASKCDEERAKECNCAALQQASWESITDERWPASATQVGTLRDDVNVEPTFEEFHPNGTRYGSPDAPIAVSWFPYNRCDVYVCARCQAAFVRYTEYGGYYMDHRVRRVEPALIA